MGDFYELFCFDAEVAAKILNITLTKRQDRSMAGIPYHCKDKWVEKLRASGYDVAICENVAPKQSFIHEAQIRRK
jgi:DNA mismatch repair protein MutS